MAAAASPYGFRPSFLTGGRPYAGSTQQLKMTNSYGTKVYNGDVVLMAAAGTVEKDTGTATATPIGIFMGCSYTDSSLNYKVFKNMWLTGTATDLYAYVCVDPDIVMQVQSGGSIAQADLGLNSAIVQGTPATDVVGNSAVSIDSEATTNTLPVKIVGFVERPGFSTVADAFTDVYVRWNSSAGHLYNRILGV